MRNARHVSREQQLKIFLVSPQHQTQTPPVKDFQNLARQSRSGAHELVTSPDEADVCLFVYVHMLNDAVVPWSIFRNSIFREHRDRCYVYDTRPNPYCNLPGIYVSMPRHLLRPRFQIPVAYHKMIPPQNVLGPTATSKIQPDLLFSFLGSVHTHQCRVPLQKLNGRGGEVTLVEGHSNWDQSQDGWHDRRRRFARSILRSKFVLCPRGHSPSSIRFYETMAAGRVPVVISDDWAPPRGIDIDTFAIRWPEGTTDGLVEYLEACEPDAEKMGRDAKRIFDQHFAEDTIWDYLGDQLETLVATKPWSNFPRYGFMPDRRALRVIAREAKARIRRMRSCLR